MAANITRKWIEKQVSAYQELMGLNDWKINLKWTCEEDSYAECTADPEYMTAVIHFNLDKADSKKEIKKTIIHELMHVVMSPMTSPLKKAVPTKQLRRLINCLEHFVVTKVETWPLWKGM